MIAITELRIISTILVTISIVRRAKSLSTIQIRTIGVRNTALSVLAASRETITVFAGGTEVTAVTTIFTEAVAGGAVAGCAAADGTGG